MGKYVVLHKLGSAYSIKTTSEGSFSEELYKNMGADTLHSVHKLLVDVLKDLKDSKTIQDVNVTIKVTARGTDKDEA